MAQPKQKNIMSTKPTILISFPRADDDDLDLLDPNLLSYAALTNALGEDKFNALFPEENQDPEEAAKVDLWITDYEHLMFLKNIESDKILLVTKDALSKTELSKVNSYSNLVMTPIVGIKQQINKLYKPASSSSLEEVSWNEMIDSSSLFDTPNLEVLINEHGQFHVKGNKVHFNYDPNKAIFTWTSTDFSKNTASIIVFLKQPPFENMIIFHTGVTQTRFKMSSSKREAILNILDKIENLVSPPSKTF